MEQPYPLARDRERQKIQQPTRYVDFAYCLAIIEEVEFSKPSSYKEVISSTDWVTPLMMKFTLWREIKLEHL
jgi:hypothetical protein